MFVHTGTHPLAQYLGGGSPDNAKGGKRVTTFMSAMGPQQPDAPPAPPGAPNADLRAAAAAVFAQAQVQHQQQQQQQHTVVVDAVGTKSAGVPPSPAVEPLRVAKANVKKTKGKK